MPPTQTRDNQGLFFPLEESDLYKKAEGGEISNMSERKAGLADLIYKKHFSSGPSVVCSHRVFVEVVLH
jgi:hypothetical protein